MKVLERLERNINRKLNISEDLTSPQSAQATVEQATTDLIEIATQLQDQISNHKKSLEDAELQLNNIIEQLNTKLGWEIRRRQPKLMVTHRGGNCNAGYYSQNLSCRPDLASKSWVVAGPLSKKFASEYPDSLSLSNTPSDLADSIVKFFTGRFKTL
jgi:hypothetical protein